MLLPKTCLLGASVILPALSNAYAATNQFWTFLSRPDLLPPKFEFTVLNQSLVSSGYFIMAPYSYIPGSDLAFSNLVAIPGITSLTSLELLALLQETEDDAIQSGPYVFDESGNLIYSGFGSTGGSHAYNVKIAQYNGQTCMTYYTGTGLAGYGTGHGVIQDSQYHTVQTVESGNGRGPNDLHEFTVLEGGTALTTIYQPTQYDLSSYGLNQPYGWVLDGVIQEIDIASGEVIFEWHSLDHAQSSPVNTYATYGSTGTTDGSSVSLAWDYFHINSIEKDAAGNYLISSRHLCALFYINGTNGSIIWQLNGMQNHFTFSGFSNNTFPFAFQHHARIHSQNGTETIISLFDNGANNAVVFHNSSAMIVAVDISTMTCTLLHQYASTDGSGDAFSSTSQGSAQILDNGNVLVGWGVNPYVSEFTEDGELILQAQFGATQETASSYRIFKEDWVGTPDSTAAIWSYAPSTSSSTTFYTSWNGATEIASWNFFGAMDEKGDMPLLGNKVKDGFETNFTSSAFVAWGYSQAVSGSGEVLGRSPLQRTYVLASNATTRS